MHEISKDTINSTVTVKAFIMLINAFEHSFHHENARINCISTYMMIENSSFESILFHNINVLLHFSLNK